MADENENLDETNVDLDGDTGGEENQVEINWESEARKTRKEAARYRTERNKLKDELTEYHAWKDSQKTELERARDEANAARDEAKRLKLEQLQFQAARKAGLDLDLMDRIRGESLEDMVEDAKTLAAKSKPSGGSAGDYGAGERGSAPEGGRSTNWLADLF